MDLSLRRLIESFHASPLQSVLALTGGGAQAASWLLSVPGGSRTILEVVIPYHEQALVDFLRLRPAQYCTAETSRWMARRAYERAAWLSPTGRCLGLGCTASLATDRPKQGDHRCHVTTWTAAQAVSYALTFRKGARERLEEDALVAALCLNALADAAGIADRLPLALLPEEQVDRERVSMTDPLRAILAGETQALCMQPDGQWTVAAGRPSILLPGAFNPVHAGHWQMARIASARCGLPVAFELSIRNVDKPMLPESEIRLRVNQFRWRAPIWITNAATFVEKAALFPGVVFVIGVDTAERLVATRYYEGAEDKMRTALAFLQSQGCRFLVAGREDAAGKFRELKDVAIPSEFAPLFSGMAQAECHVPVSSTLLRQHSGA